MERGRQLFISIIVCQIKLDANNNIEQSNDKNAEIKLSSDAVYTAKQINPAFDLMRARNKRDRYLMLPNVEGNG